jgi:penicillin V acylase-like amidase (Ntn superfamily)
MKQYGRLKVSLLLIGIACLSSLSQTLSACTRAVYLGPNNTVLTARSMDWDAPIGTNLWLFPKGIKHTGAAGPASIEWTSKYGSVIASAFDAATADGMNEKGLVTNLLYLAESQYSKPGANDKRKTISISLWAQYVLDNYSTVAEAVAELRKETFYVVPTMTPDGHPGQVHLSISDPSGDSAIFEYVDGKLVIHHDRKYQVMTNSPIYDQQLTLNNYWKEIGGLVMLPGTSRAADRFVRASFYINAIPQTDNIVSALAGVFSVIRNASAPLGLSTPGQPNIASTLWRSVADQKNLQYFFESTSTPNVFWVDFKDLDFNQGKSIKKLTLSDGIYAGNVAKQFTEATAFNFLPAEKS